MKKIIYILSAVLVVAGFGYLADTGNAQFDISQCNQREKEADCRRRLNQLSTEINFLNSGIEIEDKNQATIGSEIKKLSGEINQKSSEIKQKNSLISNIRNDITSKEKSLEDLNAKLKREKDSLKKILRKRNEVDKETLLELIISNETISDFYRDEPSFSFIQQSLSDSFDIIDQLKVQIYGQKSALEERQEAEDRAKYELQVAQREIEVKKQERDQALEFSEQKEATLAEFKAAREKEAAAIRNKLFELRDLAGGGIAFGDAYKYAAEAAGKTGVRPAFILAILEQESNLGKNVGTCNRNTNEPIWSEIMPGPTSGSWRDDQTIYKGLMEKLGRPLVGTPLSCPIKINGSYSGWGGAMGPSQFIPATWQSYENRIANAVGTSLADPWNARHAIHATALYVADLGAGAQTYTAEREAACKYYSGRGCSDPSVRNAFYGNGVMDRTVRIQSNIDLITE